MLQNTTLVTYISDFIDSKSDEFFKEINEFLYKNPETSSKVC